MTNFQLFYHGLHFHLFLELPDSHGFEFFSDEKEMLGHLNIKDGFGILNHFVDMPF